MKPQPLRVDALQMCASGKTLVHPCSFDCEPGRFLAVIGPNGAGKTSLLRGLAGLDRPAQGHVQWGDADVHTMDVRALARVRAVLLQRTLQSFDYSVLETVLMGAYANVSRWSMPASAARERALDALTQVGMESMQARSMTSLSTGEAQRVGFARVLMTRTQWWMLDEPLSNLDIKHQGQVMSIIQAHCKAGGGCVGILHDINHVERWADDVLLMQAGKVKGVGPKADVLTCQRVNEVFGVTLERMEYQGRAWWDVR